MSGCCFVLAGTFENAFENAQALFVHVGHLDSPASKPAWLLQESLPFVQVRHERPTLFTTYTEPAPLAVDSVSTNSGSRAGAQLFGSFISKSQAAPKDDDQNHV